MLLLLFIFLLFHRVPLPLSHPRRCHPRSLPHPRRHQCSAYHSALSTTPLERIGDNIGEKVPSLRLRPAVCNRQRVRSMSLKTQQGMLLLQ